LGCKPSRRCPFCNNRAFRKDIENYLLIMKYLISLISILIFNFSVQSQVFTSPSDQSQIADPIEWDARLEKQNDSIYTLIFEAKLDKGWHLYSQDVGEDGPIPTTFSFNNSPDTYELIGTTEEPDVPAIYDDIFDMELKIFKNEVIFKQQIKVLNFETLIEAEVEFSVCDEERCLPPDVVPFQFSVNENKAVQGYSNVEISDLDVQKTNDLNIGIQGWEQYKPEKEEGSGYWTIFFLGFIGGLIALLTP